MQLPAVQNRQTDDFSASTSKPERVRSQGLGDDLNSTDNVRKLRVWKRREVSVAAYLRSGQKSLPITISDVSVMGLGFRGQTGIADWTTVEVRLEDGRALAGTLVWSHNGRGGIELTQPLSSNDLVFGSFDEAPNPGLRYRRVTGGRLSAWFEGLAKSLWQNLKRLGREIPDSSGTLDTVTERACRKQGFGWLVDDVRPKDLTDDEVDKINGKREQLEGKIQERHGCAKDEARQQVNSWPNSI